MLSCINGVQNKIIIGFILALVVMFTVGNISDAGLEYKIIVWLHVLSGITWIGLLYYFNFVQVPAMGDATADTDGPGPAAIGKYVAPRALLWFRMSAATTLVFGLLALHRGGIGIIEAFTFAPGVEVIGLGSWLGTIMAFNVWFIIWPNQQKVLGLKEASDEVKAKAKSAAALASSINVILSIPMLLTMLAYRF